MKSPSRKGFSYYSAGAALERSREGKTVTIDQYAAPVGFELSPKLPLYFPLNCYKS